MKRCCLVLLVACGSPTDDLGPDGGLNVDAPSVDAGPIAHIGGWRMRAGDASRSHRSSSAGPGVSATKSVFHANTSTEEHAGLGSPIVDELGNVYLTEHTPQQPTKLISQAASGAVRWRKDIETGWSLYELNLGPDGHLYGVGSKGSGTTAEAKIMSWDAMTGAVRTGSPTIPGLARILLPPDGSIYALTYTEAAGYGLQAHSMMGASPRWSKLEGGDAYALSPSGDALVVVTVPAATAAAHTLVSLDPKTGTEKWRFMIDATLRSPELAIDTDGTIYLSMSKNGSDLHIMKLTAAGQLVWDNYASSLTWPSKILIGSQTVTIACQTPNYYGTGVTVQKSDGQPPAGDGAPCGDPQAIDKNDVIYWGCDGGVQAATPTGQIVHGWQGRYTFQVVLGPDGSAYHVPAAYFADHQLFRIK